MTKEDALAAAGDDASMLARPVTLRGTGRGYRMVDGRLEQVPGKGFDPFLPAVPEGALDEPEWEAVSVESASAEVFASNPR